MATYFVSRHAGAIEWAHRQGVEAEPVEHLDTTRVHMGDTVIGTLPIQLAADINARGARYLHLVLDIPKELRGKDISADDMERLGATLAEYQVQKVQR